MRQPFLPSIVFQVILSPSFILNQAGVVRAELLAVDVPSIASARPVVDMFSEAEPWQTVLASIPLKILGDRDGETKIQLRILGTQTTFLSFAANSATELDLTAFLLEQGRVGVVHGRSGKLSGELQLNLVLQAPANWRAELLQLTVEDVQGKWRQPASTTFPIALFRMHDADARLAAEEFACATRQLSDRANQHRRSIRKRAEPSIFHRIGGAMDLIEPRIAEDWYTRVLFQSVDVHHDPKFVALPADVKASILDYQAARRKLWEQPRRHETLVTKQVGW